MIIHSTTLRDEVKELEYDMSVNDLIRAVSSDNLLIDINNVLEDIARDNIIKRSEEDE